MQHHMGQLLWRSGRRGANVGVWYAASFLLACCLVLEASEAQSRTCPKGCHEHGVCNSNIGRCHCQRGYSGGNCSIAPQPEEVAQLCRQLKFTREQSKQGCLDDVPGTSCPNDCNQLGVCKGGWCHCKPGFYGYDCSLSTDPTSGAQQLLAPYNYTTRQRRPWIYIYDLPPQFNTHINSDSTDRPLWRLFLSRLLSSGAQTADPAKADYFMFPLEVRGPSHGFKLREAVLHVAATWPWWTANHGHRHLVLHTGDKGRSDLTREVKEMTANITFLDFWGLTKNLSTSKSWQASHRPGKDIVLPVFFSGLSERAKGLDKSPLHPLAPPQTNTSKSLQMFFSGRICGDRKPPRKDAIPACFRNLGLYSLGVRGEVFEEHWNRPGFKIDVKNPQYLEDLQKARFCLAPIGGGHGYRQVLVSLSGCTPLLIGDYIQQPFQPSLDWTRFSLSVNQSKIPSLHEVLAGVSEGQYKKFQTALPCAAQHLSWSSLIGAFMGETSQFDAFETTMEILRVMKDHPSVGPRFAALSAVDKDFTDFMSCTSSKGLSLARKESKGGQRTSSRQQAPQSTTRVGTTGIGLCSLSRFDGEPVGCSETYLSSRKASPDKGIPVGGAICAGAPNLAACDRLWL